MLEEKVNGLWQTRGQTERIMNNLNPVFTTPLNFHYSSVSTVLKFTMWDHDGGSDFELIGCVELTV